MRTVTVLAAAFALLMTASSSVALVEALGEVAAFVDESADATLSYAQAGAADAQAKAAAAQALAGFAAEHPDQAYATAGGLAVDAASNARGQAHAAEDTLYATGTYAAMHPDEVAAGLVPPLPAPPQPPTPEVVDAIAAGPIGTYQWVYGYLDGRARDTVENIDGTPGSAQAFAEQLAADSGAKVVAVSSLVNELTTNFAGVVNGHVALVSSIADNGQATASEILALELAAADSVPALAGAMQSCAASPDSASVALCAQAAATGWLNAIVEA